MKGIHWYIAEKKTPYKSIIIQLFVVPPERKWRIPATFQNGTEKDAGALGSYAISLMTDIDHVRNSISYSPVASGTWWSTGFATIVSLRMQNIPTPRSCNTPLYYLYTCKYFDTGISTITREYRTRFPTSRSKERRTRLQDSSWSSLRKTCPSAEATCHRLMPINSFNLSLTIDLQQKTKAYLIIHSPILRFLMFRFNSTLKFTRFSFDY